MSSTKTSERKSYTISAPDNTNINYTVENSYTASGSLEGQRMVEIKDEAGVSYQSLSDAKAAHPSQQSTDTAVQEKTETEKQTQSNATGNKQTTDSLKQSAMQPSYADSGNVIYNEVLVFLEGVQVPQANCSVSYGISSPPTATITIPAARFIRFLPETTKVLIVVRDLLMSPAKSMTNEQASEDKQGEVNSDGSKNGNSNTSAANAANTGNSNSNASSAEAKAAAASTNATTREKIKTPTTDAKIDQKRGIDQAATTPYSAGAGTSVQGKRYYYRVLFDGELSGLQYSINPNGATVTLQALHSVAYISLMQMMIQPAVDTVFFRSNVAIGDLVIPAVGGQTVVESTLIKNIMASKNLKSMADIAYMLIKNMTKGYAGVSKVAEWYDKKLGNEAGGYKILNRIYGVSNETKNAPLVQCDFATSKQVKSGKSNTNNTHNGTGYFNRANIDANKTGLTYDENEDRGVIHNFDAISGGYFKLEDLKTDGTWGSDATVKTHAENLVLPRLNTAVEVIKKDTIWSTLKSSNLRITSGVRFFRSGDPHSKGYAADISWDGATKEDALIVADIIISARQFNRVVVESDARGPWIHVDYGFSTNGTLDDPIVSWGNKEDVDSQSSVLGRLGIDYVTLASTGYNSVTSLYESKSN